MACRGWLCFELKVENSSWKGTGGMRSRTEPTEPINAARSCLRSWLRAASARPSPTTGYRSRPYRLRSRAVRLVADACARRGCGTTASPRLKTPATLPARAKARSLGS